ncbi:MAG: orotate phosphoribosyltransferase, partial [bacterium]|nr:orotate phosphoribosyltransferase [bacterium]
MNEILELLYKRGAIMKGHFLLSSGLHSDTYVQCALISQYPEDNSFLASKIAELFRGTDINLVVGPAIGGITIAYETARALGVR